MIDGYLLAGSMVAL